MYEVTREYIESRIAHVAFTSNFGKMIICIITLKNGYRVGGRSAHEHIEYLSDDEKRHLAYENAVEQIWPLEMYLWAERRAAEATPAETKCEAAQIDLALNHE